MARLLLIPLFFGYVLYAAYIDRSGSYTILKPKERDYKQALASLKDANIFTLAQINAAIKEDSRSGLSAFVRAVAYDGMGKGAAAEEYTALIEQDREEYARLVADPKTRLLLADIYLRQGRFEKVKTLLPRLEFLLWEDRRLVDRAYYYIGMADYLETGEMNNDFMIAAGRFEPATRIYIEKQEVQAQ